MAAVGKFRTGKNSRITVGTTNCTLKRYGVSERGGDIDTTNFECFTQAYGSTGAGGGRSFEQGLIGTESLTANVDGGWNAAQNPYDDPPGIYTRDDGPRVKIYVNRIDNTFWDLFVSRILDPSVDSDTQGLITFKATIKNQGPYYRPTGNV